MPYSFPAGSGAGTPQQEHVCAARGSGLAPTGSCRGTTRNGKQAKAGYHHGDGTLPFNIIVYSVSFSKSKGVKEVSGRSRFLWTISPSSLQCGQRSWRGGHRKCYATQRTQHRGWLPADTVQSGQRPEKWPDRSSAYRPRWKLHGTW